MHLAMVMDNLRPEQEFLSDDDEVVLVLLVKGEGVEPITGTWRMTAADFNDVYEGKLTVPVSYRDWREPIEQLLSGQEPDDITIRD